MIITILILTLILILIVLILWLMTESMIQPDLFLEIFDSNQSPMSLSLIIVPVFDFE